MLDEEMQTDFIHQFINNPILSPRDLSLINGTKICYMDIN